MRIITLELLKKTIKSQLDVDNLKSYFDIPSDSQKEMTDEKAKRYGSLTTHIAQCMELPNKTVYAALDREFKKENLLKSVTAGGICRWWYKGLLKEIQPSITES